MGYVTPLLEWTWIGISSALNRVDPRLLLIDMKPKTFPAYLIKVTGRSLEHFTEIKVGVLDEPVDPEGPSWEPYPDLDDEKFEYTGESAFPLLCGTLIHHSHPIHLPQSDFGQLYKVKCENIKKSGLTKLPHGVWTHAPTECFGFQ